jgi:hypothetical protein
MSDTGETSGKTKYWPITREGDDDPARSVFIDQVLERRRRDQQQQAQQPAGAGRRQLAAARGRAVRR